MQCCTKWRMCKCSIVQMGGCVNGGYPVELARGEVLTDMFTPSSPPCLCRTNPTSAPHMSDVEIPSVTP